MAYEGTTENESMQTPKCPIIYKHDSSRKLGLFGVLSKITAETYWNGKQNIYVTVQDKE